MTPLPPRYSDPLLLGGGGMGEVYAARDAVLGRRVAVKVLADGLAGDDTARRRFEREARTAAVLGRHPHVVTLHDAGEWDGRPYLVMELLDGSVADRLDEDGPPPPELALRWLAQAAEALDFAHERGFVHRDVKPANLLLDDRDGIRLGDLGVCRGDAGDAALTQSGEVVGTPGYLAPEVAAGGVATPASDRYSLALVARDLLGAHAPAEALARGLALDPAERFTTASALVEALGAAGPARPLQPAGTSRREARRHRSVRLARAAAVLTAVAGVALAAGAYLADRYAPAARSVVIRPPVPVTTCSLSPPREDANLVVSGADADRFCRDQAHVLALRGDEWTYRAGRELFAPNHGTGELRVVCRLARGRLHITVWDAGSRSIGRDVCGWYGSGGWRAGSIA
jgi:protein kinase-like protein